MVVKIRSPKCSLVCLGAIPGPTVSELRGVRAGARYNPPKRLLIALRQIPAVFRRRRVSPVALVHPVVVVSRVVAGLAVWRVATVSPVLVMRSFSSVHEGNLVQQWNQIGCAHYAQVGSGMSMRK